MPMAVEISKFDLEALDRILIGTKNGAVKVLVRSLNKTLTSVKSRAAKEVAADLNLPQKRIKKDFKIIKANFGNPSGSFTSKGKPVGLISFIGTRQTKAGVSVKVKKGNSRKIIRHAFIATAKNASNVFQRPYEGERKKAQPGFVYGALPKKYRFPVPSGGGKGRIDRLTGPRIEDEMDKPHVIAAIMAHANERLNVILEQEVNFELSKLK